MKTIAELLTPEAKRRFFSRVEPDLNSGCWLWSGYVDRGYGRVGLAGRFFLAHRVSWVTQHGEIPTGVGYHGVCVLHKCDTPTCVNPAHLFLGTHADNMEDKCRKDRTPDLRGERSGRAKLRAEQVLAIRSRHARGEAPKAIAPDFGVLPRTIEFIVQGVTWTHLLGRPATSRSGRKVYA